MEIIPAIDIRGGRCVRLEQGDYARETVFSDDPVAVASRWQQAGAKRLHIVDLDGAREGTPRNEEVIRSILDAAGVPVQVGGGVRDIATIQRYLDAGVQRVILGTTAVKDQTTLLNAIVLFRDRIVVGVDARGGVVATEGWLESSSIVATDLVTQLSEMGVVRIIYTDIFRDATLTGPNFEAIGELLAVISGLPSPVAVIVAGGLSSIDDLRTLSTLGVEGAIVGKAIYTGDIDLAAALAAVVP
ncbi:MAG TPA: 1-(5-phosphoribosyl)-5-[(5-phosphoribosylamino)methylideneamino]imidazole-4-carboxamide isomerase [Dehalococcoidia bacterium]|jgi:phosphoribosylformimino-5-aminoimidazole carboxamide ribotide isomerase|nr:1-(5-phosphoribosyl)-5-[(5-phosphoribosylamino)methylideneamino]imidazole-4-carboxamide isomerase [Dehalococcoidia bacterium]